MDLPRSSSSSSRPLPNPPPHSGYRPAPNGDPFLQQSRDIALTERDRQEGYDVELLNARPRGSVTGSQRRSEKDDYPVYGGAAAGAGGIGAAAAGKEGYGAGALSGHHQPSSLRHGPRGGGARDDRKWFMRPLPLLIIIGVILAVALALGLGVGLSQAHKRNRAEAATANSSTMFGTSASKASTTRSRNATASIFTETGSTTAGVVIPSSLYSSYTSALDASGSAVLTLTPSPSTREDGAVTTERARTITATTDPFTSLPSGTFRASTGNLPIPATAATTLGTEVISVVSALGGTDRLKLRRAPRPTDPAEARG